jgi:hypothetical protein
MNRPTTPGHKCDVGVKSAAFERTPQPIDAAATERQRVRNRLNHHRVKERQCQMMDSYRVVPSRQRRLNSDGEANQCRVVQDKQELLLKKAVGTE